MGSNAAAISHAAAVEYIVVVGWSAKGQLGPTDPLLYLFWLTSGK